MSDKIDTRVIQVTNLAPSCTKEQLRTLFSYLGRIKELQMFPPETVDINAVTVRVAYLEFEDATTTGVSLHLNGTVFVDRALVIVPVMDGKIPDESIALRLTPQAVAGMLPGQPTWPANVVSQVSGTGANQVITTFDPKLTSLGLPQYPPLPATIDSNVIEEIRRTVYVSNLDSTVTGEMLLSFFSQVGEVKFVRMAGEDAGYVEFSDQRSVAQALSKDGTVFQGKAMCIQHSKSQIIKPGKYAEASQREIDEAMKKVNEAHTLIAAAAGDAKKDARSPSRSKRSRSKSKGRSRSRSRTRRSRSRSKGRRRRSRSRSKRRSRSRHRSPKRSRSPRRRRSRSRGRVIPPAPPARRSRSRERRKSRSKSPARRRRSRSGSKKKRSRTPPKSYSSKRSRSRSRKRSRSRSRKRSRSRDRKMKDRKKSPSLSPPRLERNGSIPPKDGSPSRRDSSLKPEGPEEEKKERSLSPVPLKSRRRSPSPRKRSRSKSPSRRTKRRRRTRSPSPRKRSRSRSGSRHKSKRDRSKRSRSRDRKYDSKRKSTRDKDKEDKKKDSASSKVKRDYDEEEKGFGSSSEKEREASEDSASGGESPPHLDTMKEDNTQPVDMDMSD